MVQESEGARLTALAGQLRDAALAAGRRDVAKKADEVIALLARTDGSGSREGQNDTANVVLRTLDGLGF